MTEGIEQKIEEKHEVKEIKNIKDLDRLNLQDGDIVNILGEKGVLHGLRYKGTIPFPTIRVLRFHWAYPGFITGNYYCFNDSGEIEEDRYKGTTLVDGPDYKKYYQILDRLFLE